MDKNFLEIWADMFTKAAQSQKAMDSFTTWMRQGFTGIEEMTALFQKTCGMDLNPKQKGQEYSGQEYLEFWEKARGRVQKVLCRLPWTSRLCSTRAIPGAGRQVRGTQAKGYFPGRNHRLSAYAACGTEKARN